MITVKHSNIVSTLKNLSESLKNAQRVHAELDEFGQANIDMDGKRFKIAVQKGKKQRLLHDKTNVIKTGLLLWKILTIRIHSKAQLRRKRRKESKCYFVQISTTP